MQNIFDDETFFESYRDLREGENFNDLLEQPAILSLLPDLKGASVLDIGCGYGRNCALFAADARRVLGIDISKRMLNVALKENSGPNIEYRNLAMEDIGVIDESFDLIFSSLAFHYAEDFDRLIKDCWSHLKDGGTLIFSQEHPITTAAKNTDNRYVVDEEGNRFFKIADYSEEGERHVRWFVDDVVHQHRTFSTIVNTLVSNGFIIKECIEPVPTKRAIKRLPRLANDLVKPSFLIIKAQKGDIQ